MQLTQVKLVKAVEKWRYNVTIAQVPNGIYVVSDTNKFTDKVTKRNFADFALASLTFETLVSSYEGH